MTSQKSYNEKSLIVFVLGRKNQTFTIDYYEYFKDVFTGSTYERYYDGFIKSGMVRANIVSPIITNKGTITYEEAKNILETHNFYLIDNNYKKNTKKLLELVQMFNLAANNNPEKAEELATEILDSIHSIDDKKNTDVKKLVKKKNHK